LGGGERPLFASIANFPRTGRSFGSAPTRRFTANHRCYLTPTLSAGRRLPPASRCPPSPSCAVLVVRRPPSLLDRPGTAL